MAGPRKTGLYVVALLLVIAAALAVILLRGNGTEGQDAMAEGDEELTEEPAGEATAAEPGGRRPLALPSAARLQRDRAERSGTLEGQVLDFATGEPVAEAELTFSRGGAASSAITSLEGEFLFRAAEPGTYELATVTADGYLPYAPEWGHSPIRFHARPAVRILGITIHLRPELEYQGRVVDPAGRPVAGAEVVILGTPSGQTALVPLSDSHVTDEAGEFVFAAPDWALVEARREGYAPGRARVDTNVQITHRLEIRLRSGAGGSSEETISGLVVDGSDHPVAEALVSARFAFGRSGLHTTDQTVTDGAGRFTLEGLDRGRYNVVASGSGLAPGRARGVPTGTADLRLVLSQGGSLVGTVTEEATGDPVPSFSVVIQRPMGPMSRAPYRTETVFDAEGRYEVTGVEPGHYTVLVSAHGFAPSDERRGTLRGGMGESAPGCPSRRAPAGTSPPCPWWRAPSPPGTDASRCRGSPPGSGPSSSRPPTTIAASSPASRCARGATWGRSRWRSPPSRRGRSPRSSSPGSAPFSTSSARD